MTDFSQWEAQPFTYPEVGATIDGTIPATGHRFRKERIVGEGERDFRAARTKILRFGMQRGAGFRVRASTPSAGAGTVLLLNAWFLGPITIPCRVVETLDDRHRAGFAYGTLPGHPESGEDLFCVEWRADDSVVAVVTAFSRPGTWYARLGDPLVRVVQSVMTRRYLASMVR